MASDELGFEVRLILARVFVNVRQIECAIGVSEVGGWGSRFFFLFRWHSAIRLLIRKVRVLLRERFDISILVL